MAKRYTKKSTKRKSSYKKRVMKKARKSSFKKSVRKVLQSVAEKKEQVVLNLGRQLYGVASSAFDSSNNIVCGFQTTGISVSQGTNQQSRIGNKIRVHSLRIDGTLVPRAYSATTNPDPHPTQWRMILYYKKDSPTSVPTPQASNDIVQFGSTVTSFDDDLVDQWCPLNTDSYAILAEKRCKLGYAINSATNQTPGTIMPGAVSANNDFKLNCNVRWDLTKHIPKIIQYNDNNVDSITRGLYLMLVPSRADGTAIGSSAIVADFSHAITAKYTDV